jgi:hypothetical protein
LIAGENMCVLPSQLKFFCKMITTRMPFLLVQKMQNAISAPRAVSGLSEGTSFSPMRSGTKEAIVRPAGSRDGDWQSHVPRDPHHP